MYFNAILENKILAKISECIVSSKGITFAGLRPCCSHAIKSDFLAIWPIYYMGLDASKPVFGFLDKARLEPVCLATETS